MIGAAASLFLEGGKFDPYYQKTHNPIVSPDKNMRNLGGAREI